MKIRYLIDIDTDEEIEDIDDFLQVRKDLSDFFWNHEIGDLINEINIRLQDEYCIEQSKRNIIEKYKKEKEKHE